MATYDDLNVDIGNAPDDDQGDPLRTAFDKINQRFAELRVFLNDRGDWAPSTVYTANPNRDWVIVDGEGYLATSNHTSGATFAADLAAGKWVAADAIQLRADLGQPDGAKHVGGVDLQLADYTALRAYAGTKTRVYITGALGVAKPAGIAGVFQHDPTDTTSADNGGTIIVGPDGRRWKRDFDGAVNVQWFGAMGKGTTDETLKLQAAATALQSGQSIYFPPGDYIADTGCVLFRGKTRIDIFGAGEATRIRPSNQGPGPAKVDYHTTLAIDQCSFVTVRDMVIESKGEDYGNIDAYGDLDGGDPRTNAIINYGGSAVLIARSDHVTMTSVTSRYCGSCGVVYLSSCEDVVLENCFANARSLGYAGFAVDNWAHSILKPKRTYKFINCRVAKEDATYAAKAGIAAEGDETTGSLLNVEVIGGVYEDCFAGGNDPVRGNAVSAYETRLTMTGVVSKNCYGGLFFAKRGGAVDFTWCRVNGCQFLSNRVTGVYLSIGTSTGGSDLSITNTKIYSETSSVWSGVGFVTDEAVKVSSGVAVSGYSNGTIKLTGSDISGGEYGVYAIDNATFEVTGSNISGSAAAIRMYGGGNLKAVGNRMSVTSGDRVIGMETANKAATASYNSNLYVMNNLLECANDTGSNYPVILGGNSALFAETVVTGNVAPKGVYAVGKGSATFFDVDFPQTWTPVVRGTGTAGTYELNSSVTVATYVKNGKTVTVNAYIQTAASVTGGGSGELQITGLPFPKRANSAAFGTIAFSGLDYSVSKQVAPYFGTTSESSSILFWETADVSSVTLVPVSAVGPGGIIAFSITYETNK